MKDLPARGFIGSGPLLKEGMFEMMGIAVRRSSLAVSLWSKSSVEIAE
jgi:hypothetical protein